MNTVRIPVYEDAVCDGCQEELVVHLCDLGRFKCRSQEGHFRLSNADRAAGLAMKYYVGEATMLVLMDADPVEASALTAFGVQS